MTAVNDRRWSLRAAALLGLVVVALGGLLGPATPARAHAVLTSASPVPEVVLTSAPSEVVLTFSEPVRQVPGRIRVIGPDGARVDRSEPVFTAAIVRVPLKPDGARGTYLVSYRVLSADNHPVSGSYTYSVGAPSTPPGEDVSDKADPVVGAAVPVARYVGYAGLALLVGSVLVLGLLWPQRLSRRGPTRLAWTGYGLVTVATLAGLWLQVPYTAGGGPFAVSREGLSQVLDTGFGTAHLVRLGLLVAVAFLLGPLVSGRSGRMDLLLLGLIGGVGLFTWSMSGHPVASPMPAVSVLLDAVHLGSMAVWLGGLVMLFAFLLPAADERELGAILPVWSRWATVAVSALVLAGTVQAVIEVASLSALVETPYGRLVIAKALLFSGLFALAAYARRLVRGQVAAGQPGRLRRVVAVEVTTVAAVLALAAVLVQTTPARTVEANASGAGSQYFSATLDSNIYSLKVIVDPARKGNNSLHMDAYGQDKRPVRVLEWKATAALPSAGIEPIQIPLLPLTDSHATGEINLPAAGEWTLRVTIRISEIDQATVSTTVPVK